VATGFRWPLFLIPWGRQPLVAFLCAARRGPFLDENGGGVPNPAHQLRQFDGRPGLNRAASFFAA